MTREEICNALVAGNVVLGIELGSTRIKAIALAASTGSVIATGGFDWENRLEDGIWTYHLEEVEQGLQSCYRALVENIQSHYQCKIGKFAAIGISAMMHGYLAFDKDGQLLDPLEPGETPVPKRQPVFLVLNLILIYHNDGALLTCIS